MSKLFGWKIVCLVVTGMALSLCCACHSANSVSSQAANSVSSQVAKLDIVGVRLGMTPAQVKSVLSQYRKGMGWSEGRQSELGDTPDVLDPGIQVDHPYLASVGATYEVAGELEIVTVIFSPPPGDAKVVAVWRTVDFPQSQKPTVENLRSSLLAKFGQPTYHFEKESQYIGMDWVWDKTGQMKPSDHAHCEMEFGGYAELNTTQLSDMGRGIGLYPQDIPSLQRNIDDGCAIGMAARIVVDGNSPTIANGLHMVLVDPHDALAAAIATKNYVNKAKQAKKEEELKKAGANKPPL